MTHKHTDIWTSRAAVAAKNLLQSQSEHLVSSQSVAEFTHDAKRNMKTVFSNMFSITDPASCITPHMTGMCPLTSEIQTIFQSRSIKHILNSEFLFQSKLEVRPFSPLHFLKFRKEACNRTIFFSGLVFAEKYFNDKIFCLISNLLHGSPGYLGWQISLKI